MRYPSKITSYRESIISKMPLILAELSNGDMHVYDLYKSTHKGFSGIEEFIDTLDCLYALHKIKYVSDKEVIRYVA